MAAERVLMRPEAAYPYVSAAEGGQHPPIKPPRSTTLAAAPAQKAATLNDHCRRGQSMERTVTCLPETVKWKFIPAKLRPYTL